MSKKKLFPDNNDYFIDPTPSVSTMDLYLIRKSIFEAVKDAKTDLSGALLDAGCGKMPYKNFILENSKVSSYTGLDIDSAAVYDKNIAPDYRWDGIIMPFSDEKFDCAIATEVLEHCKNPSVFLKEVVRVLKPGGFFFLTVPFLWNLHEPPNDEYRYTPFSLKRLLEKAGFLKVSVIATGGWHASMAQMMGLWLRRSPLGKRKKKILSILLYPLYLFLIKLNSSEKINFNAGPMVTGLYAKSFKK